MKNLTLTLICVGLITTTAMAEDICNGAYQAKNYKQSAECYINQLKKERTLTNLGFTGFSYVYLGRYKEALPYLLEAEKKAKTSSEYKILYGYIGGSYDKTGDATQALAYKMKFLDLSIKSGVREDIGTAYSNLGAYYYRQNQSQKALEYYEKALEYKEKLESAALYSNLAAAYDKLKDYQKAEEMNQKSIEIDEKVGDYNSIGGHKVQLGAFYFLHDRNSEARVILEDALVISRNTSDISSQSHALSILAQIDYSEGRIKEAKQKASEALSLAKQSGNSIVLSDAQDVWNIVNGK
jgi:tetratricopeptide (TPR) repeat protein